MKPATNLHEFLSVNESKNASKKEPENILRQKLGVGLNFPNKQDEIIMAIAAVTKHARTQLGLTQAFCEISRL
jgi:hypothetical protein